MPYSVDDKCVAEGRYSAADQAFMFLGAAFVFLQIPGGALAQAGMLRRKNSLSIIMQTFSGFMMCSLMW